jgi:hypothetical protein
MINCAGSFFFCGANNAIAYEGESRSENPRSGGVVVWSIARDCIRRTTLLRMKVSQGV